MKTYKFRLKNPPSILNKMSSDVNFTWNFANETAIQYLDKFDKWLSGFDLTKLVSGCSQFMSIDSNSICAVVQNYAARRNQTKKRKLSWRSSKRSLRWIPLKGQLLRLKSDAIRYNGHTFRFWKSREIEGRIICGSFVQDSQGHWYVTLSCETKKKAPIKSGGSVGIDLGLKTLATLSDGSKLERPNLTNQYADKLAMAQRAHKKRRVKAIHAKIKNTRKDWAHKQTTKLINQFDHIFVGDVSPSKLKKTRMAKSVSDAGWADFKSMLAYKAIALGVEYKEVKENSSTVTCSVCLERTGPTGLIGLGVREWICTCGASHDRDVNSAQNILRLGHESPKGITLKMPIRTRKKFFHANP